MFTSTDFQGLINRRFLNNFLPIPATNKFRIGRRTPNFTLPDITHNRMVQLSDYKKQKIVILSFTRIFTEKQYCPFCFPYIISLNKNYEKFVKQGVEVLLITSTDATQSQKIIQDLNLKLPLLSDPSCHVFRGYFVGQALGAPLPAQFILDRAGNLQYKHLFSFLDHNTSIENLLNKVTLINNANPVSQTELAEQPKNTKNNKPVHQSENE
jgi:peroxiredoxin